MSSQLTVRRDLRLAYVCSLAVAVLMIVVSLASLLDWRSLFPADQAVNTVGTDAFSLLVVVPILLTSLWLARRGSLAGMLIWPGALFFALYIYAFDAVSLPPGVLFPP